MKKIVAVVLALSMLLFGSSMAAFAAEEVSISLKKEDMLRGAMAFKTMVYNKDDGSIVSDGSNISFPLPNTVTSGGSVTVRIKGTCNSDFRVWLIDANEVTASNQYKMSEHGFTPGSAFDETIVLTHDGVNPDATELFFKAPTYDGKIELLNLTYIGVTEGVVEAAAEAKEEVAETKDAAVETKDAAKATTTATTKAAPKTGVTSNVPAYLALMAIATVGFVATKKKVFNK